MILAVQTRVAAAHNVTSLELPDVPTCYRKEWIQLNFPLDNEGSGQENTNQM